MVNNYVLLRGSHPRIALFTRVMTGIVTVRFGLNVSGVTDVENYFDKCKEIDLEINLIFFCCQQGRALTRRVTNLPKLNKESLSREGIIASFILEESSDLAPVE